MERTNHQLEEEVLGLPIWLNRNDYGQDCQDCMRIIANLSEGVFTKHTNHLMWRVYQQLVTRKLPPSTGNIKTVALESGWWDEQNVNEERIESYAEKGTAALVMTIGRTGPEFLQELLVPLRRLNWERRLISKLAYFSDNVKDVSEVDFEDYVCDAIATLQDLYLDKAAGDAVPLMYKSLIKDEVRRINRSKGSLRDFGDVIKTGFFGLDRDVGGFSGGNLIVIAGRTSMGKTAIGLDILLEAAKRDHIAVDFTLEMSNQETVRRLISKQTHVDVLKLRAGTIDDWQLENVKKLTEQPRMPLFIDDRPATPTDIEMRCEALLARLSTELKIGLIVVDHLQLLGVKDSKRHESRNRQLSQYTSELKELAKHFNCPVIALSQVNRASQRERRPPVLSDLRESGSIEENADIVLGIYRPSIDDESAIPSDSDLILLKNRNGPLGRYKLIWQSEYARFVNRADQEGM